MKLRFKIIILLAASTSTILTARADEHFDTLKVKDTIYTNVTVTTVSATDIYFTHSRGMDNAKLKDLPPDLQKTFQPEFRSRVEEAVARN